MAVVQQDEEGEVDFLEDGLLWALNRMVLHPRGFALGFDQEHCRFYLQGDGSEPWSFSVQLDDEKFLAFEKLLARASARIDPAHAGAVRTAKIIRFPRPVIKDEPERRCDLCRHGAVSRSGTFCLFYRDPVIDERRTAKDCPEYTPEDPA